ncbi:MAG TPA: HAMP domain-containing sensor histidine kinase [Actinomycetes bacterium]|nr:HAMP domain-containing sensor histidine kinase [Actinomycetes bacterium]
METTTAAETADGRPDDPARPARDRLLARLRRLPPPGLRLRVLAWFVGLLTVATVTSVLVIRQVLHARLDERIHAELVQESEELRRLAADGVDPDTGRPFGANVERIFRVYLERNVPSPNEALITFVDGEPFLRSAQVMPFRLDQDRALAARWGSVRQPDRGRVQTPAGPVEFLAVPLQTGQRTSGVFVAAIFRDLQRAEADAAVRAATAVGLGVLVLGSLLAWRLAGNVAEPVADLTRTARTISETDLSRRIPVRGRDEVAQLATTFNEMLERLDRAFGSQRQFLDDAGHELRTPLTIVRGHLELLEDDPQERRETIELVLDELDRMQRIVNDLLLLAKREQPDFLNLTTVDVGPLTEELHAKVVALAPRRWGLESRGRGVIVADRQRLTQAVVQLAQNAARYGSDDGPIALGSSVAGGEARFWVRDTGPGIPAEQQEQLFERFRRGPGRQRAEAAGLGLAIVKAIAEAHHGRVEVQSRPGAGSTFTVVVPVDQP